MSRFTRTARIVAVSALGVPLTLAGTGIAQAGEGHHAAPAKQTAAQGGSLLGLLGQVNPALNAGGILSKGSVNQKSYAASQANSGIQQRGGHGAQQAVQGGDLVGGLLQVNPAANVGGIANSGWVHQNAYSASSANSGVQQSGSGSDCHDSSGGQESFQAGDLVSGLVQVNPALNVGGIANSGDVTQTAYSDSSANSGTQQSGSGHGHGGSQKAAQGGSLLGLNLQVNPAVNVGGILSSGDVHQTAAATSSDNSGIQQS
jgi:hypothetical protein